MNSKNFFALTLGAMLVCPGMQAGSVKTVLEKPGTTCGVVVGELVGASTLTLGIAEFAKGAHLAVPATLNLAWQSCRAIAGKPSLCLEETKVQWHNVCNGALSMLIGAGVVGVSVAEMKWAWSFLQEDATASTPTGAE